MQSWYAFSATKDSMTNTPVPAAGEQEAGSQDLPRWLRLLQDWKALAWPAIAALLAATCYFFGYVVDSGKRAALGIYQLDRPPVGQIYVITGAWTLATLGIQVVFVMIIAAGLRVIAREAFYWLPDGLQARLRAIQRSERWGWIVVSAAGVTAAFGQSMATGSMRDADGLILKPAKEVGTAWIRMSLDQDLVWLHGYELLLASIITIFVSLSFWILTEFATTTLTKTVGSVLAALQTFFLVIGFAFVFGVGGTVQPYPIVAFSNMEQLCGKDAIPVLIGSDDRDYAFLVLFKVGARNETSNPGKVVLYLPRSEVKWMTVLRQEPLHIIAHYHDLKTASPANPPPTLNPSGSGMRTGNTPSVAPAKSPPG
jgi:hypothetical protein